MPKVHNGGIIQPQLTAKKHLNANFSLQIHFQRKPSEIFHKILKSVFTKLVKITKDSFKM